MKRYCFLIAISFFFVNSSINLAYGSHSGVGEGEEACLEVIRTFVKVTPAGLELIEKKAEQWPYFSLKRTLRFDENRENSEVYDSIGVLFFGRIRNGGVGVYEPDLIQEYSPFSPRVLGNNEKPIALEAELLWSNHPIPYAKAVFPTIDYMDLEKALLTIDAEGEKFSLSSTRVVDSELKDLLAALK